MKKFIARMMVLMICMIVANYSFGGTYNSTICAGSSTTIGNVYPTATLYQWNTTPPQYTPQINVSPTTNTTYIVNVFAGVTWMLADTFNVSVTPVPNGTITPSQSICAGASVTLTATGGTSYLWSNGATTASITVSPTTTTTYSVVITGTGGCSITLNSTVTVSPLPTGTITPSQSICAGASATLTATGGTSYLWSNGATTASISVTPGATTTYSVVITGAGGCSVTLNSTVTVNPLPVISYIGSNSPVCSGNTINLSITTTQTGCTFAWTGPNGFTSNLQNPSIPNANTNNVGNYSCAVSLGGCSTSANTAVIVNMTPVISTIGNNSPLCSGSNMTFYASANAGSSYAWTGPNGFSSNQQNPVIANATAVNSGTYICTVSLLSCSDTATTAASVVTNPIASISGNLSICVGSNTTLTASGGTSYLWSNGATTPSITVSPTTTTVYSVVASATGGCSSAPAFATVVVNSVPAIGFSPNNPIICEGTSITITANGGSSYLWSNGATTPSITVSPTTTTNYSVTATNTTGCSATGSITLTVNPKPIVSLNLTQTQVCVNGNPITLNGGSPSGGTYYSNGNYIFGGLFYPGLSGQGTFTIYYSLTNTYGCSAVASDLLTANPMPSVNFNAIFPNPVGLNSPPIQLNSGVPLGGIYSGPGVSNGMFHPSLAGVGIHILRYDYIDFMGCTNYDVQTITVAGGLGIEDENSSKMITMYPNPVIDILNIEMEEIPDQVQILDMTGKSLLTQKVDSKKFGLNVSSLSKGVYLLKFTYESGRMGTAKFVK